MSLRFEIKISKVNNFLDAFRKNALTCSNADLMDMVEKHLAMLDDLEEIRKNAAMIKNRTDYLYSYLNAIKREISNRVEPQNNFNQSSTTHNIEHSTASTNLEYDANSLVVPKIIENFELRYLYRDVFVVGVQFANPDFQALSLGDNVELVPDPKNEHDELAVKVMLNNQRLGYLAASRPQRQQMVHDWVKRNEPIFSAITLLDEENKRIQIVIGFYRDQQKILDSCENFKTKLIKTAQKDSNGESRQENLRFLEIGEILSAEYDQEIESYIISNKRGWEMGELGKTVSEQLQKSCDKYYPCVVVENISIDDNDKFVVEVIAYLKPIIK